MSEPVQPPDPTRRRFFRQFAGDVVTSVGSALGAAQTLQQVSAEAARDLLGPDATGMTGAATDPTPPSGDWEGASGRPSVAGEVDAAGAGWRAPFRWDDVVCRVVDQRRLPETLVDLELRSAGDTVSAIADGALIGAAVQAQVAAVTLAILAENASGSRAFARRATIRGAANALRITRPGSAAVAAALDRMLALLEQLGLEPGGEGVAAGMKAEAERIIAEAVDDHGALVGHVLSILPGTPDEPLKVLVAGSTGAMGGGQFGTALSAVQTVHHSGRPIHALVTEGRPGLEGSRVAAWELRQAGVPHAVVTDGAAPGCIAAGEVQVVLVGADRIAANGDAILTAGCYPLALACAATDTPFIVCAATNALDLSVPAGADAIIEEGRPGLVLRVGGARVAPEGTQVRNPIQELVTADLVTAIVTETGVLRAPFGPAIAGAAAIGSARRASSAGYAALLAQRAAAEADAAEADAAEAADGTTAEAADGATDAADVGSAAAGRRPVDVAAMRNPPQAREP